MSEEIETLSSVELNNTVDEPIIEKPVSKHAKKYNGKDKEEIHNDILSLYGSGYTWGYIAKFIAKKWDMKSNRTPYWYINKVKAELKEVYTKDLDEHASCIQHRWETLYRRYIQEGDNTNAVKALQELGKIQGIYTTKVENTIIPKSAIQIEFVESDDENTDA